ncbi:unnamed protein product [Ectocarpus sp. CCAP 1310/34]|nr:unnamed protein product [Ectocarpus sp. CCAP 1310/34]
MGFFKLFGSVLLSIEPRTHAATASLG